MAVARKRQVSLIDTPYYHCISRCVRRAFLKLTRHPLYNDMTKIPIFHNFKSYWQPEAVKAVCSSKYAQYLGKTGC